jgi:outer membrane protein assembly factor BamD
MKHAISALLLFTLVFSGCAWFQTEEDKPAQELASDGMEAMNAGRYDEAIKAFEKLKDWYPFSKFATLAELKIADAYYRQGNYEEAIFAYENFENLHPRNEAIPYVVYQIGRCYFEQVDTVDRDQLSARKALETFSRLNRQFPNNAYASRVEDHMKRCLKSLAGHELYVGLYYFKARHYEAALNRFRTVLTEYPDVGVHRNAILYIALCEKILAEQEADEAPAETVEDSTAAAVTQ